MSKSLRHRIKYTYATVRSVQCMICMTPISNHKMPWNAKKRDGVRIFLDTVKLWCTFKALYHVWKLSAVQESWPHLGAMKSEGFPDQAYLKIVTHLQSGNLRSCILTVVYRLATLWDPELQLTSPRHPVNWISSRAWLYRLSSWIGKTIVCSTRDMLMCSKTVSLY